MRSLLAPVQESLPARTRQSTLRSGRRVWASPSSLPDCLASASKLLACASCHKCWKTRFILLRRCLRDFFLAPPSAQALFNRFGGAPKQRGYLPTLLLPLYLASCSARLATPR